MCNYDLICKTLTLNFLALTSHNLKCLSETFTYYTNVSLQHLKIVK